MNGADAAVVCRSELRGATMDQRTSRSPRIKPLPPEHSPELKDQFEAMRKNLGFIPNGILIMQRKPNVLRCGRDTPPRRVSRPD